MQIALKRRAITFGYLFASEFIIWQIAAAENARTLGVFGWLLFINPILTFWLVRIALRIQKAIITSVNCRSCGTLLDLTGNWKCGCGYTPQQPRHAFDICKKCGGKIGYFNCPKCGRSINLI